MFASCASGGLLYSHIEESRSKGTLCITMIMDGWALWTHRREEPRDYLVVGEVSGCNQVTKSDVDCTHPGPAA